MLPSFNWLNPTKVIFGPGRLSRLGETIEEITGPNSRVFLVTGRKSLKESGVLPRVIESIGEARVTLFDEVTPFPSPDLVDSATEVCRAASPDIVVAIGGGSAMDLAKSVAILVTHDGSSREFALGQKTFTGRGLPFIAVPTTSGSSSEVTPFAALWDMEAKRHMGLGGARAFPAVAIVDPELTTSMHKTLAAASGMDAFTSAFESYWSSEAEPLSDAIDLEVIRMYTGNLEKSCNQGDLESRSVCALAATMSGIAYSNSRPNVCHAVGSPLTLYWGTDHGQAVGITLSSFLRWNAPAIEHKIQALWDALGVSDLDAACARITEIIDRCGLETRLSGLGIGPSDMDTLVDNIRWDRTQVLAQPPEREEMSALLQAIM